jgi:ABC-type multidrug transport system fused ATPase/permease subunit
VQANFIQKFAKGKPEEFTIDASALQLYQRFLPYLWQHKFLFLAGSSTIFFLSFLRVLTPQVTRYIIDVIIPQHRIDLVPWVGVAILGISIASSGLSFINNYTLSIVGQNIIYTLRDDLYRHLQTLSLSYFEDRRTGTLMTRLTKDVESIDKLVTTDAAETITEIFTFFVVVSYLFYADWRLTFLLLATLPVTVYLSRLFGDRLRDTYRNIQDCSVTINNHLQETLTNAKLIKSCTNEAYEIDRFSHYNLAYLDANKQAIKLWATFIPIIDIMNSLGSIVVLSYGSWEVMQQRMSIGELTAFLAYLNQVTQPTKRYSRIFQLLQKGATALERIFEILDTQPTVIDKPDAIGLTQWVGRLQFHNVGFGYTADLPVIHQLNLTIEPGTTLALVGASGAGKSTIANLAARFYDPTTGSITIDNLDLRDLHLDSFRQQIGIVSQETLLLHGSVRENIAYGKPDASLAEIEAAAKIAHAHDFITALPQGYDTKIGERGVKLSGGQRQRIAIARASIKNPQFMILDEATSALDTESEDLIQQALQVLLKDRTCLAIAHRFSTIKNADRIAAIESGKIIEIGNHQQLLELDGYYAKLYRMQFPQQQYFNGK